MRLLPVLVAVVTASLASSKPTGTSPDLPKRVNSLPTVTASGNALFAGDERFYIRGLDYQPGGSSGDKDPLAAEDICTRDIEQFKNLGINTIRVYMTDNSRNHDKCMNALAEAGIYVILDANNPHYSINRDKPGPSYNAVYLQSVFATIDAFSQYANTLAFFSGNEVVHNGADTTLAARYVKATTRDMRQYIRSRGYRNIPVGYSAADASDNRMQMADYMNCGTEDERSDFYAFNDYSWCNSDFETSGWNIKVQNFTGYGIPLFLSEYGCFSNGRDFGEVEALMSDKMTGVYSGGLMYEYTSEGDGYGIVKVSSKGVTDQPDFKKYAAALKKYPVPKGNGGFTSTSTSRPCPTKDQFWLVDSTLLPAIPDEATKYMKNGAGEAPGLSGPGSQKADSTSTGDAKPGSGMTTGKTDDSFGTPLVPLDKGPFFITGAVFLLALSGALIL